ncbi:hypothetical protein EV651_110270 [Kribbella sp. VKM Ac-2571]|uniref:DUF7619 domain-containing protein n=1 Tax=Kribbella sp. VKM Ac-2571 TaxID=2512222 RepID=UPI00105F6497|nr:hypothetical protein [Kribbella sp. VKM Ac-2571]TDO58234.1 hypothetical protein EV651_110270 [Kribbella sp. VKM Ac-2571]
MPYRRRTLALVRGLSLALACLLTISLLAGPTAHADESPGVTSTPTPVDPPSPIETSPAKPSPTSTPSPAVTPRESETPSPSATPTQLPATPAPKPTAKSAEQEAAADDTCETGSLAQWGAPLPFSGTRGTTTSECFQVTTGAFGMYAWRLVQASSNWSATLRMYDSSGTLVYNGWAGSGFDTVRLLAGRQYTLEISGNVGSNPAGYQLGLFEIAAGGPCATAASTTFGTTPLSGMFTDGTELTCRELTEPSGSLLRVDTQATTSGTSTVVLDSTGNSICSWTASSSAMDCRLSGTAPYRVVTRSSSGTTAVPGSYKTWADNVTSAAGCEASTLTGWNSAPSITGSRSANAADCYTVSSATFGQYVVRSTQENTSWTARVAMYEPGGARVFDSFSGYNTVELKAGLNYRVVVYGDPSGYPAGYAVAIAQINGSAGCPAVASAAWDSAGTAISLTTGEELDCRQFGDAQNSMVRIRLGASALYAEVYNASGASLCSVASSSDTDCRLSGAAPYRIVTRSGYGSNHDPATATLWTYNIASTTGCSSNSLGTWQQPLPVSADRSERAADCALVTTDAFGDYVLRYAQDNGSWSGRVTIYEPTGARIYSASGSDFTTLQLKASTTYRVLFTGDTNGYPPGVDFGLYRLTGSGSCPVLSDVTWNATATSQTFSAGTELGCRELPGAPGTTFRITSPSNADGQYLRGFVFNAAGSQVCDTSYTTSGESCTLSGSAPYRIITRPVGSRAGTYTFWANDFSSTTGCSSIDSTAPISAPAAGGTMTPGSAAACWTVGLARDDRAWLSLVSTTSTTLRANLFNGAGQSLCSLGSSSSHADCALTQAGPYKLLVTGPAGDDSGYRVALRRTNSPVGCQRVDGVASGIAEQRGDVGAVDQLACVRFGEAAGDQMNFTAVNPAIAGNPTHYVDVHGPNGELVCSPRSWYTSPQCTFTTAGDHTAIVSAGSYPGKFLFSSTCVNPACGPEVLTLAGVTPQRVGAAAATTVTVRGKALATSQQVELVRGTTRITGRPIAVSADGRELQVSFDLTNAALGLYDAVVTSPSEGTLRATGALTVEGIRPAHIETGLVTLGRFVANRPQTVSVTVKNTGNVDALGAPIILDGLPAGSVVTPQFDLVGATGPISSVSTMAWRPEHSVYTGKDGKLGVPLFIGRIPAGASHQYDFTVTVPTASNYNLSALTSDCMVSSTTSRAAAADSAKDSCADAVFSLGIDAIGLIPGSSCVTFALDAEKAIVENIADNAPPFQASSTSEMFESALSAVECVADVTGPLGLVFKVLDGISAAKDIVAVGSRCFGGQSAQQTSVASLDPNELVGPAGGGAAHAVTTSGAHTFAVYFENAKTASAPAQEVRVTDHLNPAQYDLSTLRFGAVQFGTTRWTPASESTSIGQALELGDGLQLNMQASYDALGAVNWTLKTEDIVTGALPEDPLKGFLPPNVDGTEGQGVLYFTVQPKTVADGTVLSSRADVVFDLNPPIATNTWTNLVDNTAPIAKASAPASATTKTFTVSWSGSDATSGIASYDVLVATDGGPYATWKQGVPASSATYTGVSGHVYRISAIARDVAGNVSLPPPTPHATTVIRDATLLTIGKPATIKYGGSLVVATQAKDVATGAVLAKVPVVLYKRASSTAAWVKVATLTTSVTGVATSTQVPKAYTQFLWQYAGDATHSAVGSGIQVVSVMQIVSVRATASSVARGTVVKLYGAAAPVVTNQVVYLQRLVGSTWRTAGSAKQIRQRMPNGALATGYLFSLKFSSAGTFAYRVYKPAVTGLSAGSSATVSIRVR